MKCFDDLVSDLNAPRLIPSYKQNERRLLSVFMSLIEISPAIRGLFFEKCGYGSGKTCRYKSLMEVQFRGSKYPEVRPDGLVVCTRGKTSWSAFIEAKSEKSAIRPEQIQDYLKLASICDIDAIITISNEFARVPNELPYHIAQPKRKGREVFHFAWADIRTFLELVRMNESLSEVEMALLSQCLLYFWDDGSGVQTYDAMPANWPAFVEAASTALGFGANMKGLTEIVHGWQQERRDLNSKLSHISNRTVELRHFAGIRASEEDRLKADKKSLAESYTLSAEYLFKEERASLKVLADLKSKLTTVALDIEPPAGKGAKAVVRWAAATVNGLEPTNLSVSFDWPGRGPGTTAFAHALTDDPDSLCEGQKDPPKAVRFIQSSENGRAFKSRKKFIEELENTTIGMVQLAFNRGWLP